MVFRTAMDIDLYKITQRQRNLLPSRKESNYDAAATGAGAGDESLTLGKLRISTSPPALLLLGLFSSWPFSLFSLLLLSAESAGVSSDSLSIFLGGAFQRGISHTTPVKVFMVKPPLVHLRHGLPDLSKARSPALMAP